MTLLSEALLAVRLLRCAVIKELSKCSSAATITIQTVHELCGTTFVHLELPAATYRSAVTSTCTALRYAHDTASFLRACLRASPPVRFPNVYGVDIGVQSELIAHERDNDEIALELGADWVVYSDLDSMVSSVMSLSSTGPAAIDRLDCSCFDGKYVTGDIDESYFEQLRQTRSDAALTAARCATPDDLERLSFIHSPSLSPLRNVRKSPMPKSHLSSFAIGWKEPASTDSDDYSATASAAAAAAVAVAASSGDSSAAVLDLAEAPQLQLPPALQQQQQVRRGRRIAGVNKHVCNDDYKKLQDRFSGWT
eukprot:21540-Heterococcus_DN1.PRE.3